MKLAYLLFNFVVCLPLIYAYFWQREFYAKWRQFLKAFVLVSLPFIVWDALATRAGHWAFNPKYTLGWRLIGLPIEELLFFVTVPLACMFVWFLIERRFPSKGIPKNYARLGGAVFASLGELLIIFGRRHGYTAAVATVYLFFVTFLVIHKKLWRQRNFWIFQLAVFGLFIFANWFLTALPIVTYGTGAITGTRFLTIPIEDFYYNFILINAWLLVCNHE